jgi:hypothetical protein
MHHAAILTVGRKTSEWQNRIAVAKYFGFFGVKNVFFL